MLFAEQLDYTSDYWKQLIAHKTSFMSEKVVLQCLGFVKTHMKMIEARKHEGTPRERKFFYQVFHKLLSLESYVQGGPPVVFCKDEDREYILQVRRGPLEGPLARDTLYAEAEQRITEVREKLMKREKQYQEFGDYHILQTWLLSVRGISLKEPL